MEITVNENQGVEEWRITLNGSFGFEVARAFLEAMKKRARSGEARVVFDLSALDHLDSSGLGAMLLVVERFNSRCRPVIRCGDERVWAVLHVAHMEHLFDILPGGRLTRVPSMDEAAMPFRVPPQASAHRAS